MDRTVHEAPGAAPPAAQVMPPAGSSQVFISYAHADRTFVERLVADLDARGTACWVDHQGLRPGTGDWEQSLREAIRACRAVLLVASPDSRQSRYVKAELAVAELYGRPVYPLWATGEQWIESIPLGLSTTQFVDLRGERYATGLTEIALELGAMQTPMVGRERLDGIDLAPPRNPYKGLRAFTEADAADFFGRRPAIARLVEALSTALLPSDPLVGRLLAVVGPSGSGKSSLALAGLLPQLRRDALPGSAEWVYLDPIVPGDRPVEALAVVLAAALGRPIRAVDEDLRLDSGRGLHLLAGRLARRPGERVLLLVDQAEELFTLTTDEDDRRLFLDLLTVAVSEPRGPLLVCLTVRADYYHQFLQYPEFWRLLQARTQYVAPMSVEEVREAITAPAAADEVRLRFEADLVGDLLFEVRGQEAALPLLQFTLDQLVERREGRLLTQAAYRALGGVRGALTAHAEATYLGLPAAEHRVLARALFLRLVEPGAVEGEATRRRVPQDELVLPDAHRTAVLQDTATRLVAARLLSANELGGLRTLEVGHEALIRAWPRLQGWLQEDRAGLLVHRRLTEAAREWEAGGREEGLLYRGARLAAAREWLARADTPALSAAEAAFLEAGEGLRVREAREREDHRERELAAAHALARSERRRGRVARTLSVVLSVVLVAALIATGVAVQQNRDAQAQRRQASAAQRSALAERNAALHAQQQAVAASEVALSRQLAAQAVTRFDSQYNLALLLSLEARRAAHTVEARASLLQGMEVAPPGLIAFLRGQSLGVNSVAMTRDGTILASGSEDGTIGLWDMRGRRALGQPLKANAGPIWGVAFSPNGKLLAVGDNNGTVRLWDVARRLPLGPPVFAHTGASTPLVFSPDGKSLASTGDDGRVMIWDVSARGILTHARSVLACTSGAQSWALAISSSGRVLANGCTDGSIQLWEVQGPTLTSQGFLTGNGGPVLGVAFSPDSTMLASAGGDHSVRLWNVARQQQIGAPLLGHTETVFSVAFSPDGSTLASGGLDALRLWDVRRHRPLGPPLDGHTGDANSVVFSPDGATLAAGTADGSVALWDMRHNQQPSAALNTDLGQVSTVFVSPDGRKVASVSVDGTVLTVWGLTNGAFRPQFSEPAGAQVTTMAFSSDSSMAAVGAYIGGGSTPTGAVQIGDAATGRRLAQPVTVPQGVNALAFSPDGAILASAGYNGSIQFWSVARQPRGMLRPLGPPFAGSRGGVSALTFSPDGKLLAAAGGDTLIRLWDVTQRRLLGQPLAGNLAGVTALAFSPDGKLLASAGGDRTVRLWDVARRRPLDALIGHTDIVLSVAFSPDGTILASGSTAPGVRLWDVPSGQPLGAPLSTGHSGSVGSVAFTPDGTTLVAGSGDGAVLRWNTDLSTWPRRACKIANRNLTQQEWHQYLGEEPYHATCPGLPAGT